MMKPKAIGSGPLVAGSILLLLALGSMPLSAQIPVPALTARVVDRANMISATTEARITRILEDLEASDSTQIAILTVSSLEGESIEEFSIRVAEAWGIGQADNDNGVILVVSDRDRKIRIEVGYGLEGRLTDLVAGRIISNVISPAFRSGNYDAGFLAGAQAIAQGVNGEFQAEAGSAGSQSGGDLAILPFLPSPGIPFFLIAAVIVGLMVIAGASKSSRGSSGSKSNAAVWMMLGMHAANRHRHRQHFHQQHRHHSHKPGGFGGMGGGGFGGFSGGGGGFGGGGASGGW